MTYKPNPPALTHQPGSPADSASCKKPGGSPKPLFHHPNPRGDLEKVDEDAAPVAGELVFSWSIYKEEGTPYEVLASKIELCRITLKPKWYVLKIETGYKMHLLARNIYRAK